MAEQAAATAATDLAIDTAAHAGLMAGLRKSNAALEAFRAVVSNDASLLSHFQCLEEDVKESKRVAVNALGPAGMTPLLVACSHGNVAAAALLLAFGADPTGEGDVWEKERTGGEGRKKWKAFPLYIAAREGDGHAAVVGMLLAHNGVNINQGTSDSGATALYIACQWGVPHVVKMLLKCEGIDVKKARTDGGDETPLYAACAEGRTANAKLLLMHDGVDINAARTDNGITPLYIASDGGHTETVKLLLASDGIDVNKARTDDGRTPLYTVCSNDRIEIIKLLLAYGGIEINKACTDDGDIPLYIACHDGNVAIVKLLLSCDGIEVNKARTVGGDTPLYAACNQGQTGVLKLLLSYDGIEVNIAREDGGSTPLYVACNQGQTKVVKLLLAHHEIEANKARTDNGSTSLYTACFRGHAGIVKLLLAYDGIDVNATRIDNGSTPLHGACDQGHTEVVKLLLPYDGIELNKAKTTTGMTPLLVAAMNGHLIAAQLLVVYGASLTIGDNDGETLAQKIAAYTDNTQPVLVEWLNAVSTWSQLRVAAGCRLHKDAALLLGRGRIDPDDPATTTVKGIVAVLATANTKPAALPWQDAPPICKATQKLMVNATRGWHRTTHWLHHKAVRKAVFAVMVVAGRLQKKDSALQAQPLPSAAVENESASAMAPLPLLPIEIWIFAMRFVKRSWWKVE